MEDAWPKLKSKLRDIQLTIEQDINELSQLRVSLCEAQTANKTSASALSSSSAPSSAPPFSLDETIATVADLKVRTDANLKELSETVGKLSRHANGTVQTAQVERFKDIQIDLTRSYKRTADSVDHELQRSRLTSSSSSKGGGKKGDDIDPENQSLIREKRGIDASLAVLDDILGQAGATREMLQRQKRNFGAIRGKLGNLGAMVPDVDGLLTRIGARHLKEQLIIGSVLSLCMLFLLWWMLW